jgi:hypothetical protein
MNKYVKRNDRKSRFPGSRLAALVFAVLVLVFTATVAADSQGDGTTAEKTNGQKIFPHDSDVYKAIKVLYIQQGLPMPSTNGPYSGDELREMLHRLDYEALNMGGKETYDFALEQLRTRTIYNEDQYFSFNSGLNMTLESYFNTNGDFTYIPYDEYRYRIAETVGNPYSRWEYGYEEREPMLEIPLEVWLWKNAYALMDLSVGKGPLTVPHQEKNYINVLTSPAEIDFQFPFRAFLSVGGSHWNLQYGRDDLSWGSGTTGNLLLSDYPDYYDMVRLTGYFKGFKFNSFFINTDPWLRRELTDDPDSTDYDPPDYDYAKSFIGHKMEFRFGDLGAFHISEVWVIGEKKVELRYINPFMVFHNWFLPTIGNSAITLELELAPFRYVNFYGQFAIDQVQAAFEKGKSDYADYEPQAFGYLAGMTAAYPQGRGHIVADLEWVRLDPWFFIHKHPLTSLTYSRKVQSEFVGHKVIVDKPLGYEAGPDSITLYIHSGYRVFGAYSFGGDITYIRKGENDIERLLVRPPDVFEPDDFGRVAPSGIVETKKAIHLYGSVEKGFAEWLPVDLGTDLYFIWVDNVDNVNGAEAFDVQVVVSVAYDL